MTAQVGNATNQFGVAGLIVDPTAGKGSYTTIQDAINAASAGIDIFIRPGTYTENLTLKAGVNLTAFACDPYNPTVTIIGKASYSGIGGISISGVRLQTNGDYLFEYLTGAANVANVYFFDCYFNCTNFTGFRIHVGNGNTNIKFKNCYGDVGAAGITLLVNDNVGNHYFEYCSFTNTGGSSTPATNATGIMNAEFCQFFFPIEISSGTSFMKRCLIDTSAVNAIAYTATTPAADFLIDCTLRSGTAAAISVGGQLKCEGILTINSTNANPITGAGTIFYNGFAFAAGSTNSINTATINKNVTNIANLSLATPLTVANGGTGVATLTGLALASGTSNFTGVSYTALTSFTPALIFGGSPVGFTYTTRIGLYQRVGSMVYFNIYMVLSAKGSGVGLAQMILLPVASNAGIGEIDINCVLTNVTIGAGNTYTFCSLAASSTTMTFITINPTTGTAVGLTDATFSNTTTVRMSGFYFV